MKKVVVTGANKGIGLAIVKRLLKEYSDVFIYLGSRDVGRGNEAILEIVSDLGQSAKDRVQVLQLHVTSDDSVRKAVEVVKSNISNNKLYGLVNNAGGGGSHRQCVELNMYGVRRVTEAFLPLIQEKGRIVQVSSGSAPGFVKRCSDDIKELLANKKDVTWEDIENQVILPALRLAEDASLSEEEKGNKWLNMGLVETFLHFMACQKRVSILIHFTCQTSTLT